LLSRLRHINDDPQFLQNTRSPHFDE